jgi:hypothetical protein
MQFTPKTDSQFEQEEKERKERFLWPAGTIVDYEISSALEKLSKKGNQMIEVGVIIYNDKGENQQIVDYIGEWNLFKLKHICEANGMIERYEAGHVSDTDLYYKTGKAKIGIQKGQQKDDGSFYADKNFIQDYLKDAVGKKVETKKSDDVFFDDVPF